MQHSDTRILTTHTGSLPRPASLVRLYIAKARGEPVDAQLAEAGRAALDETGRKQRDASTSATTASSSVRRSSCMCGRA